MVLGWQINCQTFSLGKANQQPNTRRLEQWETKTSPGTERTEPWKAKTNAQDHGKQVLRGTAPEFMGFLEIKLKSRFKHFG